MARLILFVTALLVVTLFRSSGFAADSGPSGGRNAEPCRVIQDATKRLRCYEDATADSAESRPTTKSPDRWQLVRTPGKAGDDTISILRTADLLRSDPDFAGVSLYCGQKGPQVLVIVVRPFGPRSHPKVTLGGPINEVSLEASVLPSGAALLLPDEAMVLAKGAWQSQVELPVKIEETDATIRGVIRLAGLRAALDVLAANCPAQ